jgi:hypothetical protein
MIDDRGLLERIYDAGGRLQVDAPNDDADYPGFHDLVETLLTLTRYRCIECQAMPDVTLPGRTYLTVEARLTPGGRALVEQLRATDDTL